MKHLRETGIAIAGSAQKRQLINTGYFHGYKGYRFFGAAQNRLPFTSYDEVYATIQYDSKLKALFYEKIMFIETAVKNIALESILEQAQSENIQQIMERIVSGYRNAPEGYSEEQKKKLQQNKLNLQNMIQANLARAYQNENSKITHFYHHGNRDSVPIWALFEILTMGDFGFLLSCLIYEARDDISKKLGFNLACDTNRQLVYKYIYTLKDLRNAVAHNAVVFDTRFRRIDPTKAMKKCLEQEIELPYVDFRSIGDYIILVCYYLKLLEAPKKEIQDFVSEFENRSAQYKSAVNEAVAAKTVRPDLSSRMTILKNFI